MFTAGEPIGVAVSGGRDSMVLAEALIRLGFGPLTVLHLNHGLRGPESDRDEQFVAESAARWGVPFLRARAEPVPARDIEAWARRARLRFFADARRRHSLAVIATGHTRDDQAETVLLRLLRGTGPSGLAAIRACPSGLARPLLFERRSAVAVFAAQHAIPFREDSSNADPRFARNRLRRDLLPLLEREWNPAVVDALARTAELAARDEAHWRWAVDQAISDCSTEWGGGSVVHLDAWTRLDPAVASRVLQELAARYHPHRSGPSFDQIARVDALARGQRGEGRLRLAGVWVWRSFRDLLIARHLPSPSTLALGNGCQLTGWRPGDRWHGRKLADLLEQAKVPAWERAGWPVLRHGAEILWVRSVGPPPAPGDDCV